MAKDKERIDLIKWKTSQCKKSQIEMTFMSQYCKTKFNKYEDRFMISEIDILGYGE